MISMMLTLKCEVQTPVLDIGIGVCMGRIRLRLYMGFCSDVSSTVRLNYSVTVRHE